MRKIYQRLKDRVHLHFPLSVKWTLLTSAFVFISVIIFSAVTYRSSMSTLISQEKQKVTEVTRNIEKRLSISNLELTIRNTAYYLGETGGQLTSEPTERTLEANLIRLNSFISDLSLPELSVSVYNNSKKLVFETKNTKYSYVGNEKKSLEKTKLNGTSGFLATEPIFSKESGEKIGYIQLFYDLSSVDEVREHLIKTLIILIIGGLLISLALGFLLSSYFLRPLKKIAATMNEIKADPQTEARIPEIKQRDEFAELALVFNDMIDRMQRFIEQQQQFVGDVSHELRTPVAVIEGHLQLLNRWGKDDPEILEESLQASLQEISRMKTLVQEMLDLSRVGQVELQHKNDLSNAKEVVHQCYNNFVLLYPDFTFILDDDLDQEMQVKIYRNHFEQILVIIMDNAVKYSLDRKEVNLSVSYNQHSLEIAIQDFGEGISEEELDQVFNRFYRVDKARSRHKGGNGLGLAIAKELVETYGGTIYVDSVLGQGSVFRITLPLKKD